MHVFAQADFFVPSRMLRDFLPFFLYFMQYIDTISYRCKNMKIRNISHSRTFRRTKVKSFYDRRYKRLEFSTNKVAEKWLFSFQ